MSVLLLLIPVSLAMAAGFVALCVTSIRNGQFDDLESPRWRLLFDGTDEDASCDKDAQGKENGEIR